MSEKMPEEWEEDFLDALLKIQENRNVYWVQTKWIAFALFGYRTIGSKEFRKNKMRVYRLAERLINRGQIITTSRRETVGNSTGKSLVKYYHAKEKMPSLYEVLKHRREKNG